MASIPVWLMGQDTTALTIVPQTLNKTTGAFTAGSAAALTAVFDSVSVEAYRNRVTVIPATSTREHNVPTTDGFRVSIDIFQVYGTEPDVLLALFKSNTYFQFTLTRSGKSATGYVMFDGMQTGTQGVGEQHAVANFACVDTGASDFFTYS